MIEPFDDFMERERQRARRRLGIGVGDRCSIPDCTQSDPLRLTGSNSDLLCYEHRKARQGTSPIEHHHPTTKKIEPRFTISVSGNPHRVLTTMSRRWIDGVMRIDDRTLRVGVARMSTLFDVLRLILVEYGDDVDQLPMLFKWLDEDRPGWRKDFNSWRDSLTERDQ